MLKNHLLLTREMTNLMTSTNTGEPQTFCQIKKNIHHNYYLKEGEKKESEIKINMLN